LEPAKWIIGGRHVQRNGQRAGAGHAGAGRTADVHVAANATAAHQAMEWFRAPTVPVV